MGVLLSNRTANGLVMDARLAHPRRVVLYTLDRRQGLWPSPEAYQLLYEGYQIGC